MFNFSRYMQRRGTWLIQRYKVDIYFIDIEQFDRDFIWEIIVRLNQEANENLKHTIAIHKEYIQDKLDHNRAEKILLLGHIESN